MSGQASCDVDRIFSKCLKDLPDTANIRPPDRSERWAVRLPPDTTPADQMNYHWPVWNAARRHSKLTKLLRVKPTVRRNAIRIKTIRNRTKTRTKRIGLQTQPS